MSQCLVKMFWACRNYEPKKTMGNKTMENKKHERLTSRDQLN